MSKKNKTLETGRKPRGYWRQWENVERELTELISKIGHFPNQYDLSNNGLGGLYDSIARYHGGLNVVGQKIGYEPSRRPADYWKDWSNVEREMREVIKEIGHFPSQRELSKLDCASLSNAIPKYHGGIIIVKEKMGYNNNSRPANYWKDWSNVERELRKVIEEIGHFPSYSELMKMKKSSLANVARLYHGGLNRVRGLFGSVVLEKDKNYWKDWSNVEREMREVIKEICHFPSDVELRDAGRSSLPSSFRYHGGAARVRERLGYALSFAPRGYWQNWDNFRSELEGCIQKIGHFPSQKELKGIGKGGLLNACIYYGGLVNVRRKIGYAEQTSQELESLLERYAGGEDGQ